MSVSYTWVGWTRDKKRYDAAAVALAAAFIGVFWALSFVALPAAGRPDPVVLLLRSLGVCATALLHIVLWIGPLARLDRRLLPLLYNRRHLGVITFLIGAGHGVLATLYYHGFGNVNPLVSLLTSNTSYGSLARFPFESLGLAALAILFLMAATSHDFWNKNLTPRVWKSLHMLVYGAYGLLVLHITFGALQSERSTGLAVLVWLGAAVTAGLHLLTGGREAARDRGAAAGEAFVDVGSVDEIENNRAKVVCLRGQERIAVFRYDGKISAVSNVCEHQRGPLGEGKVVGGCITCPWHGWQYKPGDGCSPPPFSEKIATYQVMVKGRRILVNPRSLPKGTAVEPARIDEGAAS